MNNYTNSTVFKTIVTTIIQIMGILAIVAFFFFVGYYQAVKQNKYNNHKINVESHCEKLAEYDFYGVFSEIEHCKQQLSMAGF